MAMVVFMSLFHLSVVSGLVVVNVYENGVVENVGDFGCIQWQKFRDSNDEKYEIFSMLYADSTLIVTLTPIKC